MADRDVCFDVEGTPTYGTLHVPADPGEGAAALLLAGSGPADRNGDAPDYGVTPHTLKLVADVLGGLGIMSLRFDKYFSGRTGGGAFAGDPGSIDLDAFIRQAVIAYEFLQARAEARQNQMLIAGHSEGGLYALLVAQRVKPQGLALLEPQSERLLTSIEAQVTQRTAEPEAGAVARAIGSFRAGRVPDTTGLEPGVVAMLRPVLLTDRNARYVRADDAVRPVAVAATIAPGTRVLLTAGTKDANVPPSTVGPLADALAGAGTTGPGLRTLTGVDHFLRGPGEQGLAPEVVAVLTEWARPYGRLFTTAVVKPPLVMITGSRAWTAAWRWRVPARRWPASATT